MFNRLDYYVQVEVAKLRLDEEIVFYAGRGHALSANEEVLNFLVRSGYHPRLGARPLRDAVERIVGDAVAANLLSGGTGSGRLCLSGDAKSLVLRAGETA